MLFYCASTHELAALWSSMCTQGRKTMKTLTHEMHYKLRERYAHGMAHAHTHPCLSKSNDIVRFIFRFTVYVASTRTCNADMHVTFLCVQSFGQIHKLLAKGKKGKVGQMFVATEQDTLS